MGLTADQQEQYDAWRDSFRDLSVRDTGFLVDILRSMSTVLADELAPGAEGVTQIGSRTIESMVALRELIGGFLHRDPDKLAKPVATVQMRIVEEGDATALVRIAEARMEHLLEQQARKQSDGLVTFETTPEHVVDSLKQRAAAADSI
tara:strand:+ start:43 stop:486 length:444 start_codon:yes stop_codon:yes gene_type:complete